MQLSSLWWLCFSASVSLAMQDEEEIDTNRRTSTSASLQTSLRNKMSSKDSIGLLGASPTILLGPGNSPPHIPLKFWENPRSSVLKPRRKDLQESTLIELLGPDFDSRWMRRTREKTSLQPGSKEESEGKSVRALRALVNQNRSRLIPESVHLPANLPDEYKELVKQWLIRRATCPIRFVWTDLGTDFWPRWISKGECINDQASCSWPPGMSCVPGTAKVLNLLRWHCRLRKPHERIKKKQENAMTYEKGTKEYKRMRKRKKFSCQWIKVPYSVTEECTCSCSKNQL